MQLSQEEGSGAGISRRDLPCPVRSLLRKGRRRKLMPNEQVRLSSTTVSTYRIHLQRALTIPGQEHGATTSGLHDASSPFQTRHGTFPARRLLQGLCTKVASPTAQLYSCPVGPMVQNMMPRTATEKLRARPWLSRFGCWLRRRNTAIAREEGVYLVVAH